MQERLRALDQEIRQRASLATAGYSLGIAGVIALYLFLPFELSRVGSVVMIVALAHMIWKVHQASRDALHRHRPADAEPLQEGLGRVDAQIRLIQSVLYNLPFLVGSNLFWMGLPGTGSAVTKAWLDCWFLLVSVVVFGGFYLANQQTVRRELLPLRQELANTAVRSTE